MISLKDHQKQAFKALVNKKRAFLIAKAGRGKTITSLFICSIRLAKQLVKKVVYIVPNRGINSYKKDIIKEFGLRIQYIETREDYIRFFDEYKTDLDNFDIFIFKDTMLIKYWSEIKQFLRFVDMISIDECHNYRRYEAKKSECLSYILKDFNGYILGLTATLFYSNLNNVYSLFNLVKPYYLGSYAQFFERYYQYKKRKIRVWKNIYTPNGKKKIKIEQVIKDVTGYKNLDELYEKISEFVYVDNESQFKFEFQLVEYELNKDELKDYETLIREGSLDKAEVKSIVEFLPLLIPLQRHISKLDVKYNNLVEIFNEDTDLGGLVYFNYIDSCKHIAEKLKKEKGFKDRDIIILTGEDKKFNETLANLKQSDIVMMTRAGTQSLDFYFDKVIVYEAITTPGMMEQYIGRVTRLNSHFVNIKIFIFCGIKTIENYFYERLMYLNEANRFSDMKDLFYHSKAYEEFFKELEFSIRDLKDSLLWRKV